MGNMAFLLPDARTVPRNGTPPSISNVDMAGEGCEKGWNGHCDRKKLP
jgi:hypothetical protein